MLRSVLLLSALTTASAASAQPLDVKVIPAAPDAVQTVFMTIDAVETVAAENGACRVRGRVLESAGLHPPAAGDQIAVPVPCGETALDRGPARSRRTLTRYWIPALQSARAAKVTFAHSGEMTGFEPVYGRMIWQAPGAPL